MTTEYSEFLNKYPKYESTASIDKLRSIDYSRIDQTGQVYLDYTGGSLYADSQLAKHQSLLLKGVFGNPHSSSPASLLATEMIQNTRAYILNYFKAPLDEYDVVFTPNASGALKLVGESYPFTSKSQYLLTFDNHNSVNGIREFAHARGASVTYLPVALPDLRVMDEQLEDALAGANNNESNLFAYPAQSNFSSVQHPLEWIERAHYRNWDVLLDAAAFTPTNHLDLSQHKPDFVSISFYKMFGYPTGIGVLIARKEKLHKLKRPWFAGGTITVASVQGNKYYLADGHTAFEDGTVDYLNIPAIEIGLRHIESIGIDLIKDRVMCLTGWLLENLIEMKHSTNINLVKVYGPLDTKARGGTITLNFIDKNGIFIDHRFIEATANKQNISLRTGCFCNPGAGEAALGISRVELDKCFMQKDHSERLSYDDFRLCIDGKASGAVRISLGIVSNFPDVEAIVNFCKGFVG